MKTVKAFRDNKKNLKIIPGLQVFIPLENFKHCLSDLIKFTPLQVEVDLALSAHANARRWYEMKKKQESKQEKTVTAHEKAFKAAERKTRLQLSQVIDYLTNFFPCAIMASLSCFFLFSFGYWFSSMKRGGGGEYFILLTQPLDFVRFKS